jgi:hypothetical protein
MKTSFQLTCRIEGFLILFAASFFLFSCDTYNFSRPQPVDKENIYNFPKDYLGSWLSTDTSDKDTHLEYHIHKNNVLFITHSLEPVLKGAWPKINSKGEYILAPGLMQTMETIQYDSLKKPADTTTNYLFRNNKIYAIDNNGLSKGYDFKTEGDTINILRYDTTFVDLGANAFLRKLSKTMYVFNIRNTILGENNTWWRIMLLEKNDKQSFRIWVCSSQKSEFPSVFYKQHYDGSDRYYIDASWSADEILVLFNKGNFEIERELYKDPGKER